MKNRHILAGAAAAALVLGSASPSMATIIPLTTSLGGIGGGIEIDFHNFESFMTAGGSLTTTLAPGDINFGVFTVTGITDSLSNPLWGPGGSNGFLVGVFTGITVTAPVFNGTGFTVENIGGTFNLYQVPSLPNFAQGTGGYATAGCGLGTLCYNGITNVAGFTNPVLTLNLIPGADVIDPLSTLQATVAGTTIPTSGVAQGYADITGGTAAGLFGIDGFTTAIGTLADMTLLDNFCANQAGCSGVRGAVGNWQQLSNDPIGANLVPEPSSLALLGAALLGLGGMVGWRRRRPTEGAA